MLQRTCIEAWLSRIGDVLCQCGCLLAPVVMFAGLVFVAAMSAGHAVAQDVTQVQGTTAAAPASEPVSVIERQLNQIAVVVEQGGIAPETAGQLTADLKEIISKARTLRQEAVSRVETARALLVALGPPPADGEPAESDDTAKRRSSLQSDVTAAEGIVKLVDVLIARAKLLGRIVAGLSIQTLTTTLTETDISLLGLETWSLAVAQLGPFLVTGTAMLTGRLISGVSDLASALLPLSIFGSLVIAALLSWAVRRRMSRKREKGASAIEPDRSRLVGAAISETMTAGVFPVLATGLLYIALASMFKLNTEQQAYLLSVLVVGALAVIWAAAVRATLSVNRPAWRVLSLGDKDARSIHRRFHLAMLALIFTPLLSADGVFVGAAPELLQAMRFSLRLSLALALLSLLPLRYRSRDIGDSDTIGLGVAATDLDDTSAKSTIGFAGAAVTARAVLVLLLLANPIIVAVGYSRLADWLLLNTAISAIVLAAAWLIQHLVNKALTAEPALDEERGILFRAMLWGGGKPNSRTQFWARMVLNVVVYGSALLLLFDVWGFSAGQLATLFDSVLYKVGIGDAQLTLLSVAYALIAVAVLLLLTRFFKGLLTARLLPQTTLDTGVQNAITTGFGYVGFIVAALVGFSILGLDLASLALIAGALSLGIGFGLQHIVNNFVSGIILLIERPIKAGDWVEVGGYQGIVRNIRVRATEIMTFNQASVLVPNSELISGTVVNWTFKTPVIRIDIPIGVAYGSDVDDVMALLRDIAEGHRLVRRRPPPFVYFVGFGESSLDFELRVFIANAFDRLVLENELRVAIYKGLAEHNISIPFPQRDVHFYRPG